MDINAAGGGKAGLSREKIEAALGMKESRVVFQKWRWTAIAVTLGLIS